MRRGESLSVNIHGASPTAGIYMLHFADGQRYIGQAVNVVRRYAQHAHRWDDIVAVSVCEVDPELLDVVEVATIGAFERDFELRNIALTGRPAGPTVLDLVVSPAERLAWLDGTGAEPIDTPRHVDLTTPSSPGYRRLAVREDYGRLTSAVGAFVQVAIAYPRTTEQRFWTITAMPGTSPGGGWRRLATVSANNLELLVISEHETGEVGGFINVAEVDRIGWREARSLNRASVSRATRRSAVGGSIERIDFATLDDLQAILTVPAVATAAGSLATALMLKGPSMFSRFHSHHLAGDVLPGPGAEV